MAIKPVYELSTIISPTLSNTTVPKTDRKRIKLYTSIQYSYRPALLEARQILYVKVYHFYKGFNTQEKEQGNGTESHKIFRL